MTNWYDRTELLLGFEAIEKLKASNVLVVGVGGVGAAAAEMLIRAGIGSITLVDGDTVQQSNCNRQLNALSSTLGLSKVRVTGERLMDINPDLNLSVCPDFLEADEMEPLLSSKTWDFVVDAIDTLKPKVKLLQIAYEKKIPIVSAMGAGAKVDPSKIKQVDISKTFQCALAKQVRRELGLLGIRNGVPVVFSTESAHKEAVVATSNEKHKRSTVGTVSYMPVLFGCHLAAYVIQKICES